MAGFEAKARFHEIYTSQQIDTQTIQHTFTVHDVRNNLLSATEICSLISVWLDYVESFLISCAFQVACSM